jgi:hypothetical protein
VTKTAQSVIACTFLLRTKEELLANTLIATTGLSIQVKLQVDGEKVT